MVLARKKLKQRLRTLVPSGDAEEGVQAQPAEVQDIKVRLVSSKRPRPKRVKKAPPPKESVAEESAVEDPSMEEPAVEEPAVEEPAVEDEAAALALQAAKEEVERRREERRKEKKEKRRVRRLMEAENRKLEAPGSDSTVSEDGEQVEAEVNRHKLEVAGRTVQSDNPIVSGDSEQSIKKVYVGGIPYYSSEDDIRSFFEACGSITALDCMTFPETGKFRGIAILTFKTDAAAQRALALDGADMGGFFLKIQPYKANREKIKSNHEKEDFAPKMVDGYNRIYVGNLAWDITEDDLRKFFSDCKVSSIRFGTDKETGDFKGFAHVDFSEGTSLVVAMKLDQNVINGRPVKIRCAVPKKETQKLDDNVKSDSSKYQIRTCFECGTPGHLSFSCPNKKASEVVPDENKANIDPATTSLKKRRTCYECGVPGHLSSACPNKKAADVVSNSNKPVDEPNYAPSTFSQEKKIGDESNLAPSKRRKCYECGVPGHLSSACPNKKAADVVLNNNIPVDELKYAPSTFSQEKKIGDESNPAPSKRRKCYECGISGHLSSACPNKKDTEIIFAEVKPHDYSSTVLSAIPGEKKANDDSNPAPPKKKKRQTCYECGIAGHLSSECPNKAAAAQAK